MKRWIIVLATATCLAACNVSVNTGTQPAPEAGTREQQAEVGKAAKAFLTQVDADQFDATWADASPHLKDISSKTAWTTTLGLMRRSVGAKQSRKPVGIGFMHQIDGVPEGDYVAIGFNTTFENGTVQEKVVMHHDGGRWKVLGYFLTKSFGMGSADG